MEELKFVLVTGTEDIGMVAELAAEIWHQHYTPLIGAQQVEYMLGKFQSAQAVKKAIEQDGYHYYLLNLAGGVAGYLGVQRKENRLFLSKLYILESYRGQKLARKALEFIVKHYKPQGVEVVWLTCNKGNEGTLAVYNKLGFKVTDSVESDIGQGYIMDDYIMEKNI